MLQLGLAGAVAATEPQLPLSVVDEVRQALLRRNRSAMYCGAILGGFVPLATYLIAHHEVARRPALALLVLGGLLYSALSVYAFGRRAFDSGAKALGFVVLLEGVMIFSGLMPLGLAALGILMAINATSAGMRLALDSARERERQRAVGPRRRRRPREARARALYQPPLPLMLQ